MKNGKLYYQCNYKKGKLEGEYKLWFNNDIIYSTFYYFTTLFIKV